MDEEKIPGCTGADAGGRRYDLAERTARFGENIIAFARTIRLDAVTRSLVTQVVASRTSVGANYCEASEAGSRKEFRYRISVCNREIRETKHWLRMLAAASPYAKNTSRLSGKKHTN
jgi:four helix bundle protein